MTNGEKFKTAEERAEAFDRFCHEHTTCRLCGLSGKEQDVNKTMCAFRWLNTNDTPSIAELVAEMRSKTGMRENGWYTLEGWKRLCDNLDAAAKRAYERINNVMSTSIMLTTDCLAEEVERIRGCMDETIGDYHTIGGEK